jgi:hypothetical protein
MKALAPTTKGLEYLGFFYVVEVFLLLQFLLVTILMFGFGCMSYAIMIVAMHL